eukprot:gene26173-biopygen14608
MPILRLGAQDRKSDWAQAEDHLRG